MQLQAILLPPPEVIDGALKAAESVTIASPQQEAVETGGLGRLFKKAPRVVPRPALEMVPLPTPSVKVVRFGNVTSDDADNLGAALTYAATGWPAPNLHVVGIHVEQTPTQFLLTAELGGDTDLAWTIYRNVIEVGRTQRFFLDRRSFQPAFSFASLTIDGEPNPALVESIPEFELGDAATYTGPSWQVTYLDLVNLPHSPDAPLEAVAEVPLHTE